jgi:hypothetical protein
MAIEEGIDCEIPEEEANISTVQEVIDFVRPKATPLSTYRDLRCNEMKMNKQAKL